MTARLFTLNPVEGFRPKTFAGHRDVVMSAYFSKDARTVSNGFSLQTGIASNVVQPRYTLSARTALYLRGELSLLKTKTKSPMNQTVQ